LKAAQLVGFKFQALLKSSTLLNEEQINLGSRESWSGSRHGSEARLTNFCKLKVDWKKGWFQGELLTSSPTQFEPFSDAA